MTGAPRRRICGNGLFPVEARHGAGAVLGVPLLHRSGFHRRAGLEDAAAARACLRGGRRHLRVAVRGAPLDAQKLAAELDPFDINTRSNAWIEANLSQVLATAQGLKRPALKAWLGWWYRFITDCARVAQQGKPLFFTQDTVALRRLADKQPQNRWMEYLSVVESSLRSAEHPLSVTLVTDALLVQYCGMLALEQP